MKNIQEHLISDLRNLRKKGISFVILKDYFEEENFGDIDILIAKKDKNAVLKSLKELGYISGNVFTDCVFLHKLIDDEVVRLHIHFDSFFGFLDFNEVYSKSEEKYGLEFLNLSYFAASVVLKLKQRRDKLKYQKQLKKIRQYINREEFLTALKKVFIVDNVDYDEIINGQVDNLKYNPKYLNKLKIYNYKKIPRIILSALNKIIHPGEFIVFVGTDGSGKSTTVKNVGEYLKNRKFKVYYYYGGRFKFKFLPLNKLTSKVAEKKCESGESRDVIHYKSPLLKIMIPFVYYVEYMLRYLFILLPNRMKYNYILADRYFIDVIVSPNTNKTVAKILYHLMPKPSKTIFLYNDIEVLCRRRPEHPKEDIIRQLTVFRNYRKFFSKEIKTENPEQTLRDVMRCLFEREKS
jgi:thymidylate kinase